MCVVWGVVVCDIGDDGDITGVCGCVDADAVLVLILPFMLMLVVMFVLGFILAWCWCGVDVGVDVGVYVCVVSDGVADVDVYCVVYADGYVGIGACVDIIGGVVVWYDVYDSDSVGVVVG